VGRGCPDAAGSLKEVVAAVVLDRKLGAVVSFDRGYDRVPNLTRVEP
jgi:hypothetical protein